MAAIPESAQLFMAGLIARARKLKKTIVFPGRATTRACWRPPRGWRRRRGQARAPSGAAPANPPEGVTFVDPASSPAAQKYAALYYERRRAKGVTQVEAAEIATPAALLRLPDGGRGRCRRQRRRRRQQHRGNRARGAARVGPDPRARLVSSVFIMALQDRSLGHNGLMAFADCAVVIDPTPAQLADIAIATAESTRVLIGRGAGGGAAQLLHQGQRQARGSG